MITTGVDRLDGFFGGAIPPGIIVDIFGPGGAGKSMLALQAAIHAAHIRPVLIHDTTGAFRPERARQMILQRGMDEALLDNIIVYRATNICEQMNAICNTRPGTYSCIVIDNISELFWFEYHRRRQTQQRNKRFLRFMRAVSMLAVQSRTGVFLVNTVHNEGNHHVENFDRIVDLFSHVKVGLTNSKAGRMCRCTSAFADMTFGYVIGMDGIRAAD